MTDTDTDQQRPEQPQPNHPPRRRTTTAVFVACHSIVDLTLDHPAARRVLLDPQMLHKLVMSGFYGWVTQGAPDPRAQLQILHTSLADLKTDVLTVIVQSRVQPDWSRLPAALLTERPQIIQIDHRVTAGEHYTFRTVIHPTRDSYDQPGKPRNGEQRKRRTETHPAQIRAWFAERLQPADEPTHAQTNGVHRIGADGDPSQFTATVLPQTTTLSDRPGQRLIRAEIRGQLTVTDPQAFTHALTHGIGRSRSVGCGLLLAKPIKNQTIDV